MLVSCSNRARIVLQSCSNRNCNRPNSPRRIGSVGHSLSRITSVFDTLQAALGDCPTLSQPHYESVRQSPGRIVKVSTLSQPHYECPTLSKPHWQIVGHSFSRIVIVSDTLLAALGVCRTLYQPHWESVRHSLIAAWRVSDTLVMRLGECRTISQCGGGECPTLSQCG